MRVSEVKTPWAVTCPRHGTVYLTYDEYMRQLARVDDLWSCPLDGQRAAWDDENYEAHQEQEV